MNLLTRKDLKAYLTIADVTIWNWEKKGWLKPIGIGKKIYYKLEDVNSLLEKGYDSNSVA